MQEGKNREHPIVIQDIASIANVLSVVVLAVGYYFMIRLYREWVRRNRESRTAGERPMVVAAADYDHLPRVGIVVRNFDQAPAKDVPFDFSAPVESSDGFVLSGLPFFQKGAALSRAAGKDQLLLGQHAVARTAAEAEGARGRYQGYHEV